MRITKYDLNALLKFLESGVKKDTVEINNEYLQEVIRIAIDGLSETEGCNIYCGYCDC